MKPTKQTDKPGKTIGRFRKVEVRTWGDEKFRALSPIPPCAQGLWLYLITGPHTSPIPGLFRAGRAAMAEDLDWEQEAFDKAFAEVLTQGMVQADFKARVVWVPKAILYNKPESPNVVRSWGAQFDLIPECPLKRIAFDALKASIHALGEAYAEAFNEAFCKASVKACVKTMPNQEQEQEQLYSEGKPSGDAAPAKPAVDKAKAQLWKAAVSLLSGQGMPEPQARSFIGKLSKDYPEGEIVLHAVEGAVSEQPADARAYLKATCQRLNGERTRSGAADWTENAQ